MVTVCDAVIALGNEICAKSYKKYNNNVYQLDATFYKVVDYREIIANKSPNYKKHFLWFGSTGVIHKGLDLLLDYFSKRDDVFLHICGNVTREREFCKVYEKELFHTPNIYYHGFIDISSKKFKELLKQCGFVIFPSCSEGGSPSVLTCVGNGGLIPIITKQTTIDTGYEIWIDSFNEDAIHKAVEKALSYSETELIELMYRNGAVVSKRNSMERFKTNLKKILKEILL